MEIIKLINDISFLIAFISLIVFVISSFSIIKKRQNSSELLRNAFIASNVSSDISIIVMLVTSVLINLSDKNYLLLVLNVMLLIAISYTISRSSSSKALVRKLES